MNVNLKINDRPVTVDAGSTILEAAEKLDIKIPTLCHFKMDCFHVEHRSASCRICVVEVKGRPNLAPACSTPVMEGMEVKTNTLRAINARRTILDLLLSDHPKDCLTCPKNLNCRLQELAQEMGLHHLLFKGEQSIYNKDLSSNAIARDLDKCIMCRQGARPPATLSRRWASFQEWDGDLKRSSHLPAFAPSRKRNVSSADNVFRRARSAHSARLITNTRSGAR